MRPDYSLIIPSWNGRSLLEKNLPAVLTAVSGERVEVLVVDNGSSDGSLAWLKNLRAKNLRPLGLHKNFGFAAACNFAAKKARGRWLVLLNNDVVPENGFLKPLRPLLAQKNLFAVSLHEPQFSWANAFFENGFLNHSPGPKTAAPHFSFWASGGSGVFCRQLWRELGGFDLLYHPFYWEDVDLSYRAWKRGYRVIWSPDSVVFHHHESTVRRFPSAYVDLVKQRNELLFYWKNLTSPAFFAEHRRFLIRRLLKKPGYFRVVLAAFLKLPQVLAARRREKREARLTDEQVFLNFSQGDAGV